MTSTFSWKTLLAFALLHILYSKAKFACYSWYLLDFLLFIPVFHLYSIFIICPVMKRTSFLGVSCKRSCRSS